ncbi:MAG TPA: hypothetical protein V6D18_05890 [Thermosynechococcaceae cyanobacterium]
MVLDRFQNGGDSSAVERSLLGVIPRTFVAGSTETSDRPDYPISNGTTIDDLQSELRGISSWHPTPHEPPAPRKT